MACVFRDAFLDRHRANPTAIHTEILSQIRSDLFDRVNFGISTRAETILEFGTPRSFRANEDRYVVLDPYAYLTAINGHSRASYNIQSGRIFLRGFHWCISTLIHETLHSVSLFTNDIPTGNLLFLNEGLTDLLTGFLLFKRYPPCFEKWKLNNDNLCNRGNDYLEWAKIWYTFFRFVNFEEIVSLYFWNNKSWNEVWTMFIEKLAAHGLRFDNIFYGRNRDSLKDMFLNKCANLWRRDFEALFELEGGDFDFNKCARSVIDDQEYTRLISEGWELLWEEGNKKIIKNIKITQ